MGGIRNTTSLVNQAVTATTDILGTDLAPAKALALRIQCTILGGGTDATCSIQIKDSTGAIVGGAVLFDGGTLANGQAYKDSYAVNPDQRINFRFSATTTLLHMQIDEVEGGEL